MGKLRRMLYNQWLLCIHYLIFTKCHSWDIVNASMKGGPFVFCFSSSCCSSIIFFRASFSSSPSSNSQVTSLFRSCKFPLCASLAFSRASFAASLNRIIPLKRKKAFTSYCENTQLKWWTTYPARYLTKFIMLAWCEKSRLKQNPETVVTNIPSLSFELISWQTWNLYRCFWKNSSEWFHSLSILQFHKSN